MIMEIAANSIVTKIPLGEIVQQFFATVLAQSKRLW